MRRPGGCAYSTAARASRPASTSRSSSASTAAAPAAAGRGTGLGLPIARALMERWGGAARVEDRDGGGAAAVSSS